MIGRSGQRGGTEAVRRSMLPEGVLSPVGTMRATVSITAMRLAGRSIAGRRVVYPVTVVRIGRCHSSLIVRSPVEVPITRLSTLLQL